MKIVDVRDPEKFINYMESYSFALISLRYVVLLMYIAGESVDGFSEKDIKANYLVESEAYNIQLLVKMARSRIKKGLVPPCWKQDFYAYIKNKDQKNIISVNFIRKRLSV